MIQVVWMEDGNKLTVCPLFTAMMEIKTYVLPEMDKNNFRSNKWA